MGWKGPLEITWSNLQVGIAQFLFPGQILKAVFDSLETAVLCKVCSAQSAAAEGSRGENTVLQEVKLKNRNKEQRQGELSRESSCSSGTGEHRLVGGKHLCCASYI